MSADSEIVEELWPAQIKGVTQPRLALEAARAWSAFYAFEGLYPMFGAAARGEPELEAYEELFKIAIEKERAWRLAEKEAVLAPVVVDFRSAKDIMRR